MSQRIAAITGGAGNLANAVSRRLTKEYDIKLLDIRKPDDDRPGQAEMVDLMDLDAVKRALEGSFAVIHLGAIPHPKNDPPERVFQVNAMSTFNVLEASASLGIDKVVMACSDSALGFVFREREISPLYVPMDEAHPLRPQDPYGLSKLVGEEICRSYTEAKGISTVCLRFCHIWYTQNPDAYRGLVEDPAPGAHNLWAYVDVRDAAEAVALSCATEGLNHEALYITGPDAASREDSRTLAKTYFPEAKIQPSLTENSPFISWQKARQVLGYEPKHSWRKLF